MKGQFKKVSKKIISYIAKGLGVGASMLIPGVSGGTMAIILNIYDDLITAVSTFFKSKRKNLIILGSFALGGAVGMFLFSKAILYVTQTYRMPMMFLFLGAIIGSIPMLYKKASIKRFSAMQLLYPAIGFLLVFLLTFIPSGLFEIKLENGILNALLMIVAGVICAIALVLPGISVSYMLLMVGLYEPTMKAAETMDIAFLLPLLLGGIVGVFATAKILGKAMSKHSQATYLIILGFLLGSIFDVFPGVPNGIDWLICIITFAIGFGAIYFLSRVAKE